MEIVVRKGDSLWQYTQMFNINIQLINDSNQNIDENNLAVGERIRIPGFVAQDYKVRPGDSLGSIAKSRNLSVKAMELVNPDLNATNLKAEETIKVPTRV